jgi:hypothetical protein
MYHEITQAHDRPLAAEQFIDNAAELRHTLTEHGTFTFVPYRSGLFPASDLPPDVGQATGMDMAWFRDNAHVAFALYEAGQTELAVANGRAILTVLNNNRDVLDDVVSGRNTSRRLPVRVNGNTLVNDTERRVQHDATGYALWLTSRLIGDNAIQPTPDDLDTLAQTARYLGVVEYWHDADEGHWEEDGRIHGSSIGAAVAGLRELQHTLSRTGYEHDIDFDTLIGNGRQALHDIFEEGVTDLSLGGEAAPQTADEESFPADIDADDLVRQHLRHFSVERREHDAALLFLVEPLRVVDGELAEWIVRDVEENLRRDIGVIRYVGDTYWQPRFPDIMSIEERTTAAEGRIEKRNMTAAGIAYVGGEAQWTLFDPVLSTYWGRRFMETGDAEHQQKHLEHLNRSLAQLVATPDGKLQLPEAFYHEFVDGESRWIPEDHMPLLWSQANLLTAVRTFENIYKRHLA